MATQNSNNLIVTNLADGYDVSGGTTARKLTLTGADITLTGSGANVYTFPGSTATLLATDGALSALTGTITSAVLGNSSLFIGTTEVALNRGTAALTLAGITLTTPDIGTPSAGVLTNATGLPVTGLANGTDGELITWSAAGVAETVAVGTATHVLTSNGVGVAPTFQEAAGGASQLSELSDVVSATNTDKFALMANGTTGYVGRALVEADISDLGTYAATDQTFYIGTTQVAINRASAALTLAGITLTTPDLGTPTTLVGTNISGTASGLTAGTVTGFTPASGSLTLSGADALTLTTTAATDVTLPTTGTLLANVSEDTTPELGGEMDCGAHSIGFTQQAATGDGTTTIDWKLGNKMKFTFGAANETFTFTAPTNPCNILLMMVQDGTGSRTATWPGTVKWAGGVAPTLTTTAAGIDIVSFYFDGTSYHGAATLAFAVPA